MEYLLLNSHKEEGLDDEEEAAGEGKLHVGSFSDPELGEVSISAIVLKRELPGWLKPQNSNNRVFHAVNGQVQFKQTRGYFSQACGFPALKDRVVVIVNASNLYFSAHNEVWKGVEAPFTSAAEVAQLSYPLIPVSLLMKDQFRSDARIGAITVPTLVLHGELDRVVPIAFGERFYAAIRAPKQFVRFPNGEHEGLDAHGAIAAVRNFLATAPAGLN